MISLKSHKWATVAKRAKHALLPRQKTILKETILLISAEKKPNIITMFAYVQENIETVPFH
jgi:hypothetical protein